MSLQGNAVRATTALGDWTMGNGNAGYLQGNAAVAQQIRCRLLQVLGECFWDATAGINWFGFLGGKDPNGLRLALASVILNTVNVTGINSLNFNLNDFTRQFSVNWSVNTVFTQSVSGTTVLNLGV